VDCHSHIAVDGSVNEGSVSISAEVSIEDVIDADDLSIYRALAGGVTTARILHGSANTIGGRHAVLKMKWKRTADELRLPGAPAGIKFALGENPKRSNSSSRTDRFPASRMGVEAVLQRAFARAGEYAREWEDYRSSVARGDDPDPPRRDLRLEVLAGILSHDILVHSHCYRADEILMLLRVSQGFGFHIATLQHVLEGYKVAKEMADLGVGGSTFSDWWAYKIEVRTTRHAAVFVQNFHDHCGRLQARQPRKVTTGFGMPCPCQHAAGLRHHRKYMARLPEVVRLRIGCDSSQHGAGPIMRRNASRNALRRFDRQREVGAVVLIRFTDHQGQSQLRATLP
jgi:imidazolonepropionase-like amidohydrolase